jgi:hypothetical protein
MADDPTSPLEKFVRRAQAAQAAADQLIDQHAADMMESNGGPPVDGIIEGAQPSMRVRAVMKDGAIFVHLRDLVAYVAYPFHDVDPACQGMITSLLERLGEALENG